MYFVCAHIFNDREVRKCEVDNGNDEAAKPIFAVGDLELDMSILERCSGGIMGFG